MRENSRCEMMRAVGAKAGASVEMAVPPAMVVGELSVDISVLDSNLMLDTKLARERRVEKISATAIIRTSTTNHTKWFNQARTGTGATLTSNQVKG